MEVENLRMDMMIPSGLILNELFMHFVKYVSVKMEAVRSHFIRITDGKMILRYEDSGRDSGRACPQKGSVSVSLSLMVFSRERGEVTLPKPGAPFSRYPSYGTDETYDRSSSRRRRHP
jgi:hypothetical protein